MRWKSGLFHFILPQALALYSKLPRHDHFPSPSSLVLRVTFLFTLSPQTQNDCQSRFVLYSLSHVHGAKILKELSPLLRDGHHQGKTPRSSSFVRYWLEVRRTSRALSSILSMPSTLLSSRQHAMALSMGLKSAFLMLLCKCAFASRSTTLMSPYWFMN